MTDLEKIRAELEKVPIDSPNRDLLNRMMRKIDGQSATNRALQKAHDDLAEKYTERKRKLNDRSFEAEALAHLMFDAYFLANGDAPVAGGPQERLDAIVSLLKPFLAARGHDYI